MRLFSVSLSLMDQTFQGLIVHYFHLVMSRTFLPLLYSSALLVSFLSCQEKTENQQIDTSTTQATELNNEFLKKLNFPQTVSYIGLEKPKDTTVVNVKSGTAPADMVYIQGGLVQIGSDEGLEQERPSFWAKIAPFWMDTHPVTVAEFRKFIKATNYKTEAETFGNAGIIDESTGQQWILKDGANWHHPMGPDFPAAADDHPVTQVSWNDANAYAKWVGKRLPCELEWEHAARNARNAEARHGLEVGERWPRNPPPAKPATAAPFLNGDTTSKPTGNTTLISGRGNFPSRTTTKTVLHIRRP